MKLSRVKKSKKKLVLKQDSKKEILPDLDEEVKSSEKKVEILQSRPFHNVTA